MKQLKKLQHGMLLDSKHIMDNAMTIRSAFRQIVPAKLHLDLERLFDILEDELCAANVSDRYQEKTE